MKKWLIDWFLKNYLVDLVKRLSGYKIFVALLILIVQAASTYFAGQGGLSDALNLLLESLSKVGSSPLSPEETNVLIGYALGLWGVLDKLLKALRGAPQVPYVVEKKRG